jgi:replicative DNA helicase
MSDLAQSGSIEQDAANIIFLYRDVIWNKDTPEPEIAEIISTKQRQGTPGTVGMKYNGSFTLFEDLPYRWERKQEAPEKSRKRGFD